MSNKRLTFLNIRLLGLLLGSLADLAERQESFSRCEIHIFTPSRIALFSEPSPAVEAARRSFVDRLLDRVVPRLPGGLAIGLAMVVVAFMLVASRDSAADSQQCARAAKVEIGNGKSPSKKTWRINASIKNNGSCEDRLLEVDFQLPGLSHWGVATGVKAYSHLPLSLRIDGRDERGPADQAAFSGYIGSAVGEIRASLAGGGQIKIIPRVPPRRLRHRYLWLRGFAFFVRYHSPGRPVVAAAVYDRHGHLLYRVRGKDGEFF